MPSKKQQLLDRDYYGEYQKKSCYSVEQWEKILSSEAFVSPTELAILKEIFMSANHAAPLSQLAYRHNKDTSYYVDKMNQLARNIGMPNGYKEDVDLDGNEYWWYLLFWGKKNKLAGLEWKLLPELAEAMEYMFPDMEDKYNTYMSEIERSEQIRYTKEDSVWIASTLLLLEKVYLEHPIDIYDLLLMQYEISQRAQKVYGQDVDIDVITDNCNADSGRCILPYLRDIDKYWRICYPGEIEDAVLRPEKIDYNAYVFSKFGYLKLSELVDFAEGEYCKLTDPNYVEIDTSNPFYKMISFLQNNAKKRYMDLTAPTEEDIERFLNQKEQGKEALNAFHAIGEVLRQQYPSFTQTVKAGWLEKDNTTIRSSWVDSFETADFKGAGPQLSILCGQSDASANRILFSVALTFPIESADLTNQVMDKCSNLALLTSANFRVDKTIHLDTMYSNYFGNAVVAYAEFDGPALLDTAFQDAMIQFETAIQILASYYLDICETVYQPQIAVTPVETNTPVVKEATTEVHNTQTTPTVTMGIGGGIPAIMPISAPKRSTEVTPHGDRTDNSFTMYPKNILFKGPAGCGKLDQAIRAAVGIIEGIPFMDILNDKYEDILARYQTYREAGRILYSAGASITYNDWMDSPAGEGTFTSFCNQIAEGRFVCIVENMEPYYMQKSMKDAYYLLDNSKREGQPAHQTVELPHSMKPFSIPSNLYFVGTSTLSLTDAEYCEMFHTKVVEPNVTFLDNIIIKGISMRYLLETMNQRLAYLIGEEYQIGHRYFEPLRNNKTIEGLGEIMHEIILPMLLGWFYDASEQDIYHEDPYEGVRLIFGDYKKSDKAYEMITKITLNPTFIFGSEMGFEEKTVYKANKDAFYKLDSYLELE